ncbi:MAG: TetR/AcrR family transcriptional regulator [Actinobacteria bacterium]|nr:TetR/AcrR family transcriptional regulator [Actinomycetota bacterium]
MASSQTDGRLARTERTRTAILDALLELLEEGVANPSSIQIAERAGISKRSLFVHYSSLEDLHQDLAERATATVVGLVWVVDPALPLAERVDAISEQRARVHEAIGPLRRAGQRRAATSEAAATAQRFGRDASRDQLRRVFAAELDRLEPTERDHRTAALEALTAGEAWDLWRESGRTVEACREVLRHGLLTLLGGAA